MLTEIERDTREYDIERAAKKAAKEFKARPHSYARKGNGKSKGKRKSQHKSRTRPTPTYKAHVVRPPNPYKPGSAYHRLWRDSFKAYA